MLVCRGIWRDREGIARKCRMTYIRLGASRDIEGVKLRVWSRQRTARQELGIRAQGFH